MAWANEKTYLLLKWQFEEVQILKSFIRKSYEPFPPASKYCAVLFFCDSVEDLLSAWKP